MPRIYLDTCVLRLAYEAKEDEVAQRALDEIGRDDATFLYSRILELELLPQPTRNRKEAEVEFYQAFFEAAEFVPCTPEVTDLALGDALRVGMTCADALHVGCAVAGGADELVTAESATKPLPKATLLPVRTIRV